VSPHLPLNVSTTAFIILIDNSLTNSHKFIFIQKNWHEVSIPSLEPENGEMKCHSRSSPPSVPAKRGACGRTIDSGKRKMESHQ